MEVRASIADTALGDIGVWRIDCICGGAGLGRGLIPLGRLPLLVPLAVAPFVDEAPATVCRIVIACLEWVGFAASGLVDCDDIVGDTLGLDGFAIVCQGAEGVLVELRSVNKPEASGVLVSCSFICCCILLRSFCETFTVALDGAEAVRIAWVRLDT